VAEKHHHKGLVFSDIAQAHKKTSTQSMFYHHDPHSL
jgi:hypothetical protein